MNTKPKPEEQKSRDRFFALMYQDLRAWNRQIPESPERIDPVLRILLQLFAYQLTDIDKRLDATWDVATKSLIKSMAPEAKRWPIPAFTVMRCEPADPVVEIDPHTKFFYKEKREGGQTFFFCSQRQEKLIAARVRHSLLVDGNTVTDLIPSPDKPQPASRTASGVGGDRRTCLHVAVEFGGLVSDFRDASLFLRGDDDVLKQLRWAYWYPGDKAGQFSKDAGFCPGLTSSVEGMFSYNSESPVDWGGLRTSTDLFGPLENSWVVLPESFADAWEIGPPGDGLSGLLDAAGVQLSSADRRFYWMRVDLPPGGDKRRLHSPLEMFFNCFAATNRNELTVFKHTGGNPLVEIELPEHLDSILDIVSVIDSQGTEYLPRYRIHGGGGANSYALEQRDNRLVLWFDFSSGLGIPPDALTVTYSVTAGVAPNGIAAGKITELYESHPGILSAANILPVQGAIPAKGDQQLIAEISARLRNRDRALTFADISSWVMAFDPRIRKVECKNGIERARRGVRRCIVVTVTVKQKDIYSEDEVALLARRLTRFLKSRSPINTHFAVEIKAT
ncbi:MAG TPA: hypothetical protein VMY05_10135 [Acidobacteriota bacterium]|nr:hypothetical protein [Acidobacteriota bacterium]